GSAALPLRRPAEGAVTRHRAARAGRRRGGTAGPVVAAATALGQDERDRDGGHGENGSARQEQPLAAPGGWAPPRGARAGGGGGPGGPAAGGGRGGCHGRRVGARARRARFRRILARRARIRR